SAQSPADVVRVLKLQQSAPKPTVAFCMGDIGQPSRFLALKYGAPFVYAALNKERGIAPGLPSMEDFRTTYPVRSIKPDTRVFGVVGDPVGHSFSPLLHNHLFQRLKVNAVYLPFRVPRGQLPQALDEYNHIPVAGYRRARDSGYWGVLSNCPPVGMHSSGAEAPIHFNVLKPGQTVFDTIYTPETTLLIREAKLRGCEVITGVDMFVRQAARQFE